MMDWWTDGLTNEQKAGPITFFKNPPNHLPVAQEKKVWLNLLYYFWNQGKLFYINSNCVFSKTIFKKYYRPMEKGLIEFSIKYLKRMEILNQMAMLKY